MDEALVSYAAQSISTGSKSFAAAAKLFDRETRASAVMLYAWCRHCDDVIDGQVLGFRRTEALRSPDERLRDLVDLTRRALAGEVMQDPGFAAFQHVVHRHAIPARYPLELLAGFRMDVEGRRYRTLDDTLSYCYHVAGVVGVMMSLIMGGRDEQTLDRAVDLGLAFQLTNIARDIIDDARVGRVYLPEQWLNAAGVARDRVADPQYRTAVAAVTRRLLDTAELYYQSATHGLPELPLRSAWAVATAHAVYRCIGVRVRDAGPAAWDQRISTSKIQKIGYVISGLITAAGSRLRSQSVRPPELWQRPR